MEGIIDILLMIIIWKDWEERVDVKLLCDAIELKIYYWSFEREGDLFITLTRTILVRS